MDLIVLKLNYNTCFYYIKCYNGNENMENNIFQVYQLKNNIKNRYDVIILVIRHYFNIFKCS